MRLLGALFLSMFLLGCDLEGGTYDPAVDDATAGGIGSSSVATTSGGIAIPDELISFEDGSATVAAIQSGVDPYSTLINTNFACFNESSNDYQTPYLTMSVSGANFSSTLGNGTISTSGGDGDLFLRGAPFDSNFEVNVLFGKFGQSFDARANSLIIECFQYGSSLERAYNRFLINTPEAGTFTCRDTSSNAQQSLVFYSDGSYQIGSGAGTYRYRNIITYNDARIDFSGGPLNGESVRYREDPLTGRQSFRFIESTTYGLAVGSSTSVTSICDRVRTPRPFKEYGFQAATLPARPSVALSGMYFVADLREENADTFHDWADNYTFTPDGFSIYGTPGLYAHDCTRTQPNGLNHCGTYEVDGDVVRRYNALGNFIVAGEFETNGSGEIVRIYGRSAELVTPMPSTRLSGVWVSDYFASVGCDTIDFCSFTESARTYRFSNDGNFDWRFESGGYTGAVSPVGSAVSASSDGDFRAGRYEIQGNLLIERLNDGQTRFGHIYQTRNGNLSIDGYLYFVPEP